MPLKRRIKYYKRRVGLGLTQSEAHKHQETLRLKKAQELADILFVAGWSPEAILSDETWIQAVIATGRPPKLPSIQTVEITLEMLAARYKDRQSLVREMHAEDLAATRKAEEQLQKKLKAKLKGRKRK